MNWKKEYEKELAAIPKEKKQMILDLLWSGLCVGEICKKVNMPTLHVSGVICENIDDVKFLCREAK